MRKLRIAAASVFLVCSFMSLVFALEVALITSEVSRLSGPTDIYGRVDDPDGEPLANVSVTLGTKTVYTDGSGSFELQDIPQGKVVLELYKDGYAGERLGLVAYPDGRRWMGDEGHPNDLRDDPFVLYEEMDWQMAGEAEGVTVDRKEASSGNATIDIVLNSDGLEGPVRIVVMRGGESIGGGVLNGTIRSRTISYELTPGICNVTIAGPRILDRGLESLDLRKGTTVVNITLEGQDFFEIWTGQGLKGNYSIASLYALIGVLCGAGAYLVLRTDRWTWLVLISTVSFFGRGPFEVFGANLMPLFALSALVLTVLLREDMMRRRSSFRPRPSEMP